MHAILLTCGVFFFLFSETLAGSNKDRPKTKLCMLNVDNEHCINRNINPNQKHVLSKKTKPGDLSEVINDDAGTKKKTAVEFIPSDEVINSKNTRTSEELNDKVERNPHEISAETNESNDIVELMPSDVVIDNKKSITSQEVKDKVKRNPNKIYAETNESSDTVELISRDDVINNKNTTKSQEIYHKVERNPHDINESEETVEQKPSDNYIVSKNTTTSQKIYDKVERNPHDINESEETVEQTPSDNYIISKNTTTSQKNYNKVKKDTANGSISEAKHPDVFLQQNKSEELEEIKLKVASTNGSVGVADQEDMVSALCEIIKPFIKCKLSWMNMFHNQWDGGFQINCKLSPKLNPFPFPNLTVEYATPLMENWERIKISKIVHWEAVLSDEIGVLIDESYDSDYVLNDVEEMAQRANLSLKLKDDLNTTYKVRVLAETSYATGRKCIGEPSNIILVGKHQTPTNFKIIRMNKTSDHKWTGTIAFEWSPPRNREVFDRYLIQYSKIYEEGGWFPLVTIREVKPNKWKDTMSVEVTHRPGVSREVTYIYRMKAKVDYEGNEWWTDPTEIIYIATPSCPQDVKIFEFIPEDFRDAREQRIYRKLKVKWKEPQSDGNSPIIKYIVERRKRDRDRKVNEGKWDVGANVTGDYHEAEMRTAEKPTKYEIRVQAVNMAGISSGCYIDFVDKPVAPKNFKMITLDKKKGTIDLTWEEPTDCGNRECERYIINMYPKKYVENLMADRDGIMLPEFSHKIKINRTMLEYKNKMLYYTLHTDELKAQDRSNQTKYAKVDKEKLKIDLKDGRSYKIMLRAQNTVISGDSTVIVVKATT